MNRIPSLIALATSGLLVAASALAQGQSSAGGDNPKPAGSATQATTDTKASTKSSKHATAKKTKHTKSTHKSTAPSTSSADTAAATGVDPQMKQCLAKNDRNERAECARKAWESAHPTT
jgi:hypothetical protein